MTTESVGKLEEIFKDNQLFRGFDSSHFEQLSQIITESRSLEAGEVLMNEGDTAEELYIIEKGVVEILVQGNTTGTPHVLAELTAGECVGELALMDHGKRSAQVRAIEPTQVSALKISDLRASSEREKKSIESLLIINLASRVANRMRTTNEGSVRYLEGMLEHAEKRVEMGKFMSRVLLGTCLYIFVLAFLKSYQKDLGDSTFVTVPIIFAYAIGLALNIKTSIYPMRDYGFNLDNWQAAVKESLLFSAPVLIIVVLVKWLLVSNLESMRGMPVFDFYQSANLSLQDTLLVFVSYTIFAPVQELIARSGIQSSMEIFLNNKHKTWTAIFLSTLCFSSTHLHVSLMLALLVFPLGLFWGWLYSRHPTIIGPIISHVIIGCFGLFVVGFTN